MLKPVKDFWRGLPAPFRNRYYVALAVFFLILIFIDRNDLLSQWKLSRTIKRMEAEKASLQEQIIEARKEAAELNANLEKFAREKYHMKRSNEEVFIIEKNNKE